VNHYFPSYTLVWVAYDGENLVFYVYTEPSYITIGVLC